MSCEELNGFRGGGIDFFFIYSETGGLLWTNALNAFG